MLCIDYNIDDVCLPFKMLLKAKLWAFHLGVLLSSVFYREHAKSLAASWRLVGPLSLKNQESSYIPTRFTNVSSVGCPEDWTAACIRYLHQEVSRNHTPSVTCASWDGPRAKFSLVHCLSTMFQRTLHLLWPLKAWRGIKIVKLLYLAENSSVCNKLYSFNKNIKKNSVDSSSFVCFSDVGTAV